MAKFGQTRDLESQAFLQDLVSSGGINAKLLANKDVRAKVLAGLSEATIELLDQTGTKVSSKKYSKSDIESIGKILESTFDEALVNVLGKSSHTADDMKLIEQKLKQYKKLFESNSSNDVTESLRSSLKSAQESPDRSSIENVINTINKSSGALSVKLIGLAGEMSALISDYSDDNDVTTSEVLKLLQKMEEVANAQMDEITSSESGMSDELKNELSGISKGLEDKFKSEDSRKELSGISEGLEDKFKSEDSRKELIKDIKDKLKEQADYAGSLAIGQQAEDFDRVKTFFTTLLAPALVMWNKRAEAKKEAKRKAEEDAREKLKATATEIQHVEDLNKVDELIEKDEENVIKLLTWNQSDAKRREKEADKRQKRETKALVKELNQLESTVMSGNIMGAVTNMLGGLMPIIGGGVLAAAIGAVIGTGLNQAVQAIKDAITLPWGKYTEDDAQKNKSKMTEASTMGVGSMRVSDDYLDAIDQQDLIHAPGKLPLYTTPAGGNERYSNVGSALAMLRSSNRWY
jgi:hypothetical protein